MESILPILIGLAVLVLQAVASNNKKKEAARRGAEASRGPQSYAPPQEEASDPFEEWVRSLTAPRVEESDEESGGASSENVARIEEGLYPQDRRPSVEMQMAVATIAPVAEQPPQDDAAAAPVVSGSAWRDEVFDVEKAIVYSEILQRKFFV
ncbi:MAG: hypothetical protein LBD91_02550 [Prevotellaceae bacterium]|jgi:hypothetical protein|nr:hypothetical protein [Prevotellaceae bacterium]